MNFRESHFNKENLKPKEEEYTFDINNYDFKDENFQNFLEDLKENNPSKYNEILDLISIKEEKEHYSKKPNLYNPNIIPEKNIKALDVDDKETPTYDLYKKYQLIADEKRRKVIQPKRKLKYNKEKLTYEEEELLN